MKTIYNNQFGAEPAPIVYYADRVNVNTNIRSETITTTEGLEVVWYADSTYYLPDEYSKIQDTDTKLKKAETIVNGYEIALHVKGDL